MENLGQLWAMCHIHYPTVQFYNDPNNVYG